MEVGGGMYEKWNTARKKKKNESDSDRGSTMEDEGDSFGSMNPIQLTKSLNGEIDEIKSAKVLRNGALMIMCKNER